MQISASSVSIEQPGESLSTLLVTHTLEEGRDLYDMRRSQYIRKKAGTYKSIFIHNTILCLGNRIQMELCPLGLLQLKCKCLGSLVINRGIWIIC